MLDNLDCSKSGGGLEIPPTIECCCKWGNGMTSLYPLPEFENKWQNTLVVTPNGCRYFYCFGHILDRITVGKASNGSERFETVE